MHRLLRPLYLSFSASMLSFFVGSNLQLEAVAQTLAGEHAATEDAAPISQTQELHERFAKTLTRTTLVGNFTVTGEEKPALTPERYELQGVQHVKDEFWLFQARIRYGDHDVTLPITLPVRWAGDTPVICVDNMGFPGLGTYTARVMIYADHYAGFWQGGDHGGHLFGVVERPQSKPASGSSQPKSGSQH